MKIESSVVKLTSSHELREEDIRQERLRFWSTPNGAPPDSKNNERAGGNIFGNSVRVEISHEARLQYQQMITSRQVITPEQTFDDTIMEDPKMQTIRLILEGLTGRKIKISQFKIDETPETPVPTAVEGEGTTPPQQGWGLEYDLQETHSEQERVRFTALGQVITSEGKEINFQLDFSLSREFMASTNISIRAGDAQLVDPLMVNFDGQAAELNDLKFDFDLDGDGREEEVPMLAAGSGYLVLDRNNDGIINNGLELFGPATGNGFAELHQPDSDSNGWIDENDPIYDKLQIWAKDAAGNDHLYSLKEKNIGAVLLASVATPFSYKNTDNTLYGQLQASSIFLREDSTVGTIQEIDLAV